MPTPTTVGHWGDYTLGELGNYTLGDMMYLPEAPPAHAAQIKRTRKHTVEFYATNPGGREFQFQAISWEGNWPKINTNLEWRELEVTVLRKVPINQGATIRMETAGRVVFRGYVEYLPEIDGGKKTILCVGMEKLLNARIPPNYFYVAGYAADIETLFADSMEDGAVPGLFAICNGHLPPGWSYTVHDAGRNIIKLPGMGKNSRWANKLIFICGLYGATALTKESELANLNITDNGYFQDDTDLYVRISTLEYESGWYELGGLVIGDGFDTTCRLGNMVGGTSALRGDLEITIDSKLGDLIVNLAKGHGLYVHVRDSRDYTYFDIDDEEGAGSEDGIFELREADCFKFKRRAGKDPRCSSLTGKGQGSQYYTKADMTFSGPWIAGTYDVAHGFKDSQGFFVDYVDNEFAAIQLDYQWEVGTYRKVDLMQGDFIKLMPNKDQAVILSCEKITRSSTGETTLALGAAQPRFADSWAALQEMPSGFTDKTLWNSNISDTQSTTCYPHDPGHAGTAATLTFPVPDNVLDTALVPRVTLTPSISYNTSMVPISQRCVLVITVGGVRLSPICGITVSSSLEEIDITDRITENANNTVTYNVYFSRECEGTHIDYNGHPRLSVSGTVAYYKRMSII